MVQYFYPAMLRPAGKGGYRVAFPDLEGCISQGSTVDEAVANAHQSLRSHLEKLVEEGTSLPSPIGMGDRMLSQLTPSDAIWAAITVEVEATSERVNVYLPKSLIERADRAGAERGMSRSSVFGAALDAYIGAFEERARAREIAALAYPNVQMDEDLMLQASTRGKVIAVDSDGFTLGLGELGALLDGKPVFIFDTPSDKNHLGRISIADFEIDLTRRLVTHKPSKIGLSFYEYQTELDWEQSDTVTFRDNPKWPGDRRKLAAAAKVAAVAAGMTARKPT